jgi:hypothetical protein
MGEWQHPMQQKHNGSARLAFDQATAVVYGSGLPRARNGVMLAGFLMEAEGL